MGVPPKPPLLLRSGVGEGGCGSPSQTPSPSPEWSGRRGLWESLPNPLSFSGVEWEKGVVGVPPKPPLLLRSGVGEGGCGSPSQTPSPSPEWSGRRGLWESLPNPLSFSGVEWEKGVVGVPPKPPLLLRSGVGEGGCGSPSQTPSPSPEWSGRRGLWESLPNPLSFSGVEWEKGVVGVPPKPPLLLRSGVGEGGCGSPSQTPSPSPEWSGRRGLWESLPNPLSFSGVEWEKGVVGVPPKPPLLLRSGVGEGGCGSPSQTPSPSPEWSGRRGLWESLPNPLSFSGVEWEKGVVGVPPKPPLLLRSGVGEGGCGSPSQTPSPSPEWSGRRGLWESLPNPLSFSGVEWEKGVVGVPPKPPLLLRSGVGEGGCGSPSQTPSPSPEWSGRRGLWESLPNPLSFSGVEWEKGVVGVPPKPPLLLRSGVGEGGCGSPSQTPSPSPEWSGRRGLWESLPNPLSFSGVEWEKGVVGVPPKPPLLLRSGVGEGGCGSPSQTPSPSPEWSGRRGLWESLPNPLSFSGVEWEKGVVGVPPKPPLLLRSGVGEGGCGSPSQTPSPSPEWSGRRGLWESLPNPLSFSGVEWEKGVVGVPPKPPLLLRSGVGEGGCGSPSQTPSPSPEWSGRRGLWESLPNPLSFSGVEWEKGVVGVPPKPPLLLRSGVGEGGCGSPSQTPSPSPEWSGRRGLWESLPNPLSFSGVEWEKGVVGVPPKPPLLLRSGVGEGGCGSPSQTPSPSPEWSGRRGLWESLPNPLSFSGVEWEKGVVGVPPKPPLLLRSGVGEGGCGSPSQTPSPSPEWSGRRGLWESLPNPLSFSGVEWEKGVVGVPPKPPLLLRSGVGEGGCGSPSQTPSPSPEWSGRRGLWESLPNPLSFSGVEWEKGVVGVPPKPPLLLRSGVGEGGCGSPSQTPSPSPEWSGRRGLWESLPNPLSFSGVEWEKGVVGVPPKPPLLLRSGVGEGGCGSPSQTPSPSPEWSGRRGLWESLPNPLSFSGVEWEKGVVGVPPKPPLLLRSGVGEGGCGSPSQTPSPSPEWSGRRGLWESLPNPLSFSGVEWEKGVVGVPPKPPLLLRSGVGEGGSPSQTPSPSPEWSGRRGLWESLPNPLSFSGVEWEKGVVGVPPKPPLLLRSGVGEGGCGSPSQTPSPSPQTLY